MKACHFHCPPTPYPCQIASFIRARTNTHSCISPRIFLLLLLLLFFRSNCTLITIFVAACELSHTIFYVYYLWYQHSLPLQNCNASAQFQWWLKKIKLFSQERNSIRFTFLACSDAWSHLPRVNWFCQRHVHRARLLWVSPDTMAYRCHPRSWFAMRNTTYSVFAFVPWRQMRASVKQLSRLSDPMPVTPIGRLHLFYNCKCCCWS